MRLIYLIYFQLFIFASAVAQTGLNGKVYLEKDPASGAMVHVQGLTDIVFTDSEGKFSVKNIPSRVHKIQISYPGAKDTIFSVDLSSGNELFIEVRLLPDVKTLKEIILINEPVAEQLKKSPWAVSSIDAEEIKHESAGILSSVNKTAGVRVRQNGGLGSSYNLSINGLEGKAVRIFIDEVPLKYYGRAMDIALFPVHLIERVDIYKGVLPVSLGADALGGGVNITTTKPGGKSLSASYQLGSFNTHRGSAYGRYLNPSSGFFAGFNGYLNYSDNNYNIEAEVIDPVTRNPEKGEYKRFHDRLLSWMGGLETGWVNKIWADQVKLNLTYAFLDKQVQHGIFVGPWAVGEATYSEKSLIPSLRWEKQFGEKFQVDLFTNYILNRYHFVDTSSHNYSWNGNIFSTNYTRVRGELNPNRKSNLIQNRNTYTGRINLRYELGKDIGIILNHIYTYHKRSGTDLFSQAEGHDAATDKSENIQNLSGISLTTRSSNQKLENVFAFKFNQRYSKGTDYLLANQVKGQDPVMTSSGTALGWSYAGRYRFTKNLVIKTSYEYANRFPDETELFGEPAYNLISNPALETEKSHNLNLGFVLSDLFKSIIKFFEVNGFYRNTRDLIFLEAAGFNLSKYSNIEDARTIGAEISSEVNLKRNFILSSNLTWLDKVKTSYRDFSDKVLLGKRVPNVPYFYFNFGMKYNHFVKNKSDQEDIVQLYWYYNYYHEYNYTWEIGSEENRPVIPTQHIQTAGISYIKKAYSINLEIDNLTNAKAYDNYFVQRPGRNFQIKLNYFL